MNRPMRGRPPSRDFRKPSAGEGASSSDSRKPFRGNSSSVQNRNRRKTSESQHEGSSSPNPQASSSNEKPNQTTQGRGRRGGRLVRNMGSRNPSRAQSENNMGQDKYSKSNKATDPVPRTFTILYSRNMSPERSLNQRKDCSFWDDDESDNDLSQDRYTDISDGEDPGELESEEETSTQENNSVSEKISTTFVWNTKDCPVPSGLKMDDVISRLLKIGRQDGSCQPKVKCLVQEFNVSSESVAKLRDVEMIVCDKDEVPTFTSILLQTLVDLPQQQKVYLIGITLSEQDTVKFKRHLEIVHVKNGSDDCKSTSDDSSDITLQELLNKNKSQAIDYSYVEVEKVSSPSDMKKLKHDLRKMLKCSWCKIANGKALLRFRNLPLAEKMCKEDSILTIFGKDASTKILTKEESIDFLAKFKENQVKVQQEKKTKTKKRTVKLRLTGEISEDELKEKLTELIGDDCFTISDFKRQINTEDSSKTRIIVSIILDGKMKARRITKALHDLTKSSLIKEVETYLEETTNTKNKLSGLHLLEEVDKCKDDLTTKRRIAEDYHQKKIEANEIAIKKATEAAGGRNQVVLETLQSKKQELDKQMQEFQKFSNSFFERLDNVNIENLTRSRLNDLRMAFACEIKRLQEALPIYAAKSEILDAVLDNQVIVLLAETGSGKSTQLVQYLLQTSLAKNGLIVCTQPRRIAASSLATHVAHQMSTSVGHTVGYQAGITEKKNKFTKIMYMTDHYLLSEILEDPDLKKYSCIIIDEAHERSIYTDLLIAMVKLCLKRRNDLKVIITSATIDPQVFVKYFDGCPVLRVAGRTFPVEIMWNKHNVINTNHDYVTNAVDTVLHIHTKDSFQQRGDILVFLTGILDIENAIQLMNSQEQELKDSLIVLPLHGKLQPDQQNSVFNMTPKGKRKIVFATNIAETSVTIPGIKYVIDCGYMKEIQFDPKRNLSSLDIRIISQSSAEQRKGRAGRMEPGFCYRMYSEDDYSNFKELQKPELLRTNLGQAVLKLLELGITNIQEFNFVEAPSADSLQIAISSLRDLGAIHNGKITPLGLKMSKLSVTPHLAKLILHGIEKDIGFEALIIAACATVSSSLFFRCGTDDEKATADAKKTLFCLPEGDFITELEVYKEWLGLEEKKKSAWCFEKKINSRAMHLARDTINEFNMILKRELGQPVKLKFSSTENINTVLRRLIFESYFKNNLCLSYGPEKAGYLHLSTNQTVHIHPSSALNYLGRITPKFIVYNTLLKTTKAYTIGITPVDEDWVKEMIDEGKLQLDWNVLQKITINPKVIAPIGSSLLAKALIGKGNAKRIAIEKMLAKELGEEVGTDASIARGEFIVYAQSCHHEKIKSIIEDLLKEEKSLLSSEIEERQQPNSNLRILVGYGGEVHHLLYPEEFCQVSVNTSSKLNSKEILNVLSTYGEIACYQEQQKPPKKLFAIFRNPIHAKEAVNKIKAFRVVPNHRIKKKNSMKDFFRLKVLWTRRQNRGFGFIEPKNADDLGLAISHLKCELDDPFSSEKSGISTSFKVDLDKKTRSKLFVGNLERDVNNEMFRSELNDILRPHGIQITDAFVIPDDPFTSHPKDCEMMEKELKEILDKFVPLSDVNVHILTPSPRSSVWLSFVGFKDPEIGQSMIDLIHLKERIKNQRLFVKADLNSTLYCDRDIYEAVKGNLPDVFQTFKKLPSQNKSAKLEISAEDVDHNRKAIRIISDSVTDAAVANFAISKLLTGNKMECDDSYQLRTLMTPNGRKCLQKVMADTSTFIVADCNRKKWITLYGDPKNIETAKERIKSYIDKKNAGFEERIISLLGEDKPKGLIKHLLLKYGSTLKGLQEETGVESLHLNLYNHHLLVFGTVESVKMVNTKLEDLIGNLKSKPESTILKEILPAFSINQYITEICPVCFTEVNVSSSGAHFRLQLCGHSYCWECIQGLIGSRTLPLKCIYKNCNELFCIKDIKVLTNNCGKTLEELQTLMLENFIKKQPQLYGFCITPNCKGIYKCTNERFTCLDCKNEICTRCKVQYHHGFSCEIFQKSQEDENYPLKVWMKKNVQERKYCPSCSIPIEKLEGCNYMHCTVCLCHFCWKCEKYFDSEVLYTLHQNECP